jgi:hypothetical protein
MGIGFDLGDGKREYFEALFSEGFSGPHDPAKLAEFRARDHHNRLAIVELDPRIIPYTPADVFAIHAQALSWATKGSADHKGYGRMQLASMLLFERFGIPLRHSESRVVCSEADSRLLVRILDLRSIRNDTHDTVSPASAWLRTMTVLAGYAPAIYQEIDNDA